MITVNVNNTVHQFQVSASLQDLISQLKIPDKGIALAMNNQIISKADWSERQLNHGDNILIIQATQGG